MPTTLQLQEPVPRVTHTMLLFYAASSSELLPARLVPKSKAFTKCYVAERLQARCPSSCSLTNSVKTTRSYQSDLYCSSAETEPTCANMSFIASLVSESPLPSMRRSRKIFTCRHHTHSAQSHTEIYEI